MDLLLIKGWPIMLGRYFDFGKTDMAGIEKGSIDLKKPKHCKIMDCRGL
jgi:hypothetical protein